MHPPGESWICDRFTKEFREHCADISVNSPYDADVIWLIADWCWRHIPYQILKRKKVVTTNFHIVPEKFDESAKIDFGLRDDVTDLYHASCNKTAEYLKEVGATKPIWTELVWVNGDMWRWIPDPREIRKELGIKEDDYVIGSFQRDTEGHDLKSPKLEKGPDIFCDYVELKAKEKNVIVLLGGWRRQYVINRLEKAGIRYIYKELPSFEELNKMYNALDLYVVGSRYEGGPQSILECATTLTPIISTDVGVAEHILAPMSIAKEFSGESLMECKADVDHALEKVTKTFISFGGFDVFRKKLEELCEER